jgi:hypothetical protein
MSRKPSRSNRNKARMKRLHPLASLVAAFPVKKSGRLLQLFFRGLLSVHSRYGLHARRVA